MTWVPVTDMDCSLMTSVTSPFLNLEVHRLSGGFTQTGSPILYGLWTSPRLDRHMPSIPFIQSL